MSFVKIIFQLVRNGRYIFPIPPCLSFLNTFASALKQRRLLEQLQRAAVESSMSSAPLLCRLRPILSSSCLFLLFKMAHCPLLPVPRLGSSFIPEVISGDFVWCPLAFVILCDKKIIGKHVFIFNEKQLEGKKKSISQYI